MSECKALVSMVRNPSSGHVLAVKGREIEEYVAKHGVNDVRDFPLEDGAPEGLSIWEGSMRFESNANASIAEAAGKFRPSKDWKDEEWGWMRDHGYPWEVRKDHATKWVAAMRLGSHAMDATAEYLRRVSVFANGDEVVPTERVYELMSALDPVFADARVGQGVNAMRLKRDAVDYVPVPPQRLRMIPESGIAVLSPSEMMAIVKELLRARVVLA